MSEKRWDNPGGLRADVGDRLPSQQVDHRGKKVSAMVSIFCGGHNRRVLRISGTPDTGS